MSACTSTSDPKALFRAHLRSRGLRMTPQREQIMDIFLHEAGHLTTEELYLRIQSLDPSLGQATVYRTVKLLCEAGVAREVRFGDGVARYEKSSEAHHDHLICERCGKNLEVLDPEIERLQEALARAHGFVPTFHRLYLYGICSECREQPENERSFSG